MTIQAISRPSSPGPLQGNLAVPQPNTALAPAYQIPTEQKLQQAIQRVENAFIEKFGDPSLTKTRYIYVDGVLQEQVVRRTL